MSKYILNNRMTVADNLNKQVLDESSTYNKSTFTANSSQQTCSSVEVLLLQTAGP
jgi:hypothetical protein